MRKKILTVLLALCMVISLLPIAAFAAQLTEAQIAELKAKGYTDEQIEEINKQIASYESDEILLIFEDTTISADEARLVIVAAPKAVVTVKGAKLETGIVVAPGAAEAKVVLTEAAEVNAVVVLDKAEVVVEKDTKAANLTVAKTAEESTVTVAGTVDNMDVDAPNTTVAVDKDGSVGSVTVSETAEGTTATVAGSVGSMTVDAPKTTTEVAEGGSVDAVTVGENATETEINAADGATVGEVVDPAGNNTGNTAEEPAPAPSTTPAPAPSTPAETETEPDPEPDPDEPVAPGPVPDPASPAAPAKLQANQILEAPLADNAESDPKEGEALAKDYNVDPQPNPTAGKIKVVFGGEVASHTAGDGETEGNWVGLAIPKKSADEKYTYECYLLRTKTVDGVTTASFGKLDNDSTITEDYIEYDTYYFDAVAAEENDWEDCIYVVASPVNPEQNGITDNEANQAVDTLIDAHASYAPLSGDDIADQVQEIKDTMGNSAANSVVGEIKLDFSGVENLVPPTPAPESTPAVGG